MKGNIIAVILLTLTASTLLIACSEGTTNETTNIKQIVHDYSVGNITTGSASITSKQLTVIDGDGNKTAYDLPEEEFFVSIAPYINESHP
ncbi:hypothetical protein HNQ94_001717 [Salirhabdus euzebyi]|uniref:Uncharacterized protein n=3 Tax=Salirhabdus euzebyi TaxID=394506 RepID=A0A841Q4C0_9BACI|nr:hypothetical protein [Salirhabdus euzebyi]